MKTTGKRLQVTIIGAGSVVFAKKMMNDLSQMEDGFLRIVLMDIDPERLKLAGMLGRGLMAARGGNGEIVETLDRREAIRGADYVICMIQVGGFEEGTLPDFEIPKRYGLRQTIADTLGVGGVFRALRTIPELIKIARDIEEVAKPGCLLLNYSNPMAMNCRAIDRAVGIPHVGLCHSVQGTSRQLAMYCGIPYNELDYLVGGINHMAFFLKLEHKGKDLYPLLFRMMEEPGIFNQNKVRFEMMRRLGYYVTESSEHQSEYLPYFIPHGAEFIQSFDIPLDEYLRRCRTIMACWEDTRKKLIDEGMQQGLEPLSLEYGGRIIQACESGEATLVYGNVPNRGYIENLPEGCCVEVPCRVDASGLHPQKIGRLHPQLAAICTSNINVQELAVEAALTGKREHVYHAVMMDPNTSATLRLDEIWKMCDELIEFHQKVGHLPQFKPVFRRSGRSHESIGETILARLELFGGFNDKADASNELSLVLENRDELPRSVTVRISVSSADVWVEGEPERTFETLPNSRQTATVRLLNRRAIHEPVRVELLADDPKVFALGQVLTPRPTLHPDEAGWCPVQIGLGTEVALSGAIKLDQQYLHLKLRVEDSNPVEATVGARESSSWTGSWVCVSLATETSILKPSIFIFAFDGNEGAKVHQLKLSLDQVEMPVTLRQLEASYELEATIPTARYGLGASGATLLVNLEAKLNALGDAHSGGVASFLPNGDYAVLSATTPSNALTHA